MSNWLVKVLNCRAIARGEDVIKHYGGTCISRSVGRATVGARADCAPPRAETPPDQFMQNARTLRMQLMSNFA